MASSAVTSVGASFKRGDGASSEVFTAIAEVNSIGGPDMSRDIIDVTSLDSTGGYKEFLAGHRDPGEITLEMNFTYAGYNAMLTDFEADTPVNYQIVLPDTPVTTFDMACLVTSMGMATTVGDRITASVTLKVTSEITVANA